MRPTHFSRAAEERDNAATKTPPSPSAKEQRECSDYREKGAKVLSSGTFVLVLAFAVDGAPWPALATAPTVVAERPLLLLALIASAPAWGAPAARGAWAPGAPGTKRGAAT